MRTNIVIDDGLMAEAMKVAGTTMRETVAEALRRIIQLERQRDMLKRRGKISWVGDLDTMRAD